MTQNKILMKAMNINTRHGEINIETVSTFIFCLGLKDFAQDYKNYFKRYGEVQHGEKMVEKYRAYYILKPVD